MNPASLALLLLTLCGLGAGDQDLALKLFPPNKVAPNLRTYTLADNYCYLLEHASARVSNKIFIDGGMAKFKIDDPASSGNKVGVADISGFTVALDLTADFTADRPLLRPISKKSGAVTSLSKAGLWTDGVDLWIQGGKFPAGPNISIWYQNPINMPQYEVWKLHDSADRWQFDNFKVEDGSVVQRTESGAGACTGKLCYWLGFGLAFLLYSSRADG